MAEFKPVIVAEVEFLRWTRNRPTKPGGYWMAAPEESAMAAQDMQSLRLVVVYQREDGLQIEDDQYVDYVDPDTIWAGPIPFPVG